jgi:predicted nucleic acid-binding protein
VILVDAGPLVALISADDARHEHCRDALAEIEEPIGTVWPAITEAMYLLGGSWQGQESLWDMLHEIEILPLSFDDLPRMRELMEKYRDLPMDLADAALVRVAERENIRIVFTLDRRDFSLYRPIGLKRFTILPRKG